MSSTSKTPGSLALFGRLPPPLPSLLPPKAALAKQCEFLDFCRFEVQAGTLRLPPRRQTANPSTLHILQYNGLTRGLHLAFVLHLERKCQFVKFRKISCESRNNRSRWQINVWHTNMHLHSLATTVRQDQDCPSCLTSKHHIQCVSISHICLP